MNNSYCEKSYLLYNGLVEPKNVNYTSSQYLLMKWKKGLRCIERGWAYHINRVVERPRIFIWRSRAPDSINKFGELICFDPGESPVSHLFGAGHVTYSSAFAFWDFLYPHLYVPAALSYGERWAYHVPSIAPNLCRFWRTELHPGELMRFQHAQRPEANPFTVRRTNTIRRLMARPA